jgi:hypothetical protein
MKNEKTTPPGEKRRNDTPVVELKVGQSFRQTSTIQFPFFSFLLNA